MENQEIHFETMPGNYLLCFNDACPLADGCLHRLAARCGKQRSAVVTAVNPAVCHGEGCPYHRPNHIVTMAYGMKNSFHDVKADDIAALRNALIRHFGHGSYYVRRNGTRPITPDEQAYIAGVFGQFGYTVAFDRMAEETLWI